MFYKGEIPLVRLLTPLVAGICLAYYLADEAAATIAWSLLFISFGVSFLLSTYYRKFAVYRRPWLPGLAIHIFMLCLGYGITVQRSGKTDRIHYSHQKAGAFVARVSNEPKATDKLLRFEADVKRHYLDDKEIIVKGKIAVSVFVDTAVNLELRYGDLVLMPAVFGPIDPPFNPGEFDYRTYLADRQIYDQAFLNAKEIYLAGRGAGNPFISFALDLRQRLVEKFRRYLPDADAAAFASTLILGYRAELSRDLVEAYSKTGTMHVLSVSGMHVGIVYLVLSSLLKFMDRSRLARLLRAVLIIAVVWFYALLTGFSAPANRAAIMLSFIVVGKTLNRNQNTYNLIAISAFFLLLYNPFYLFDAGFQLSYLAVTGLVYFHPKIYHTLYIKNKAVDYIWTYSALSVAAQLATFPLSVYYFHQFPVYFLLCNLLIILPVAVIMYTGIIFLFISYDAVLPYLAGFLNYLVKSTNAMLYDVENLPFSTLDGIWISRFECAMICGLIIFTCLVFFHAYRELMRPAAILLLMLLSSFSIRSVNTYNKHQIIFFNLRKSSGLAYIYKHRSVIVSDLEAEDRQKSYSILPAVQCNGSGTEVFYRTGMQFSGTSFTGEPNFYQFGKYRLIRWDRNFDHLRFKATLNADAILISSSPKVKLKDMVTRIRCSIIIIDVNNPDYKIAGWLAEARNLGLPCYVLKKNPALIVKL